VRKVRFFGVLALLAVTLALSTLAGAGAADTQPAATNQGRLTIGFVTHVRGNPFIQQIIDGAMAAGSDLGVTVRVAGPPEFDANAQLKLVQDLVAAGADGVATSIPGESMVRALNDLIDDGTPIVQFNLMSRNLRAPYVGERSTQSGRILGRLVANRLGGRRATGKVIIGICAPGFPVLENRARGVKQGLRRAAPRLNVRGPFDVKVAANENFAAWEQLYSANTDARAFVGLCAPDVASVGKLNRQIGNKLVAGGYDTTAENLAAIERGNAFVTLGQTPFVQGYMPVKMLVDAIRAQRPAPRGFLDSGTEVVTRDGAVEPYGLGKISFQQVKRLANSKAATRAYYNRLVKGKLRNYRGLLEPLANEGK
jgi:ABC-type sugar transport system substrate-binding protein